MRINTPSFTHNSAACKFRMNQGLEGQTKAERQGNFTNLYYMGYEKHIEGKHEIHGFGQSNLTLTLIHIDAIRVVGAQLGLLGTLGFTWVTCSFSQEQGACSSPFVCMFFMCVIFFNFKHVECQSSNT